MSDSRAIDRESRRLIREELLTNILVEAGAGSGKTQMLAERMAAGVAAGAYQIEHMAAVTFTRKAASELRGRFHLALEELVGRGFSPGDCELVGRGFSPADCEARVRAALANLERFFAGTIHSFCARLLRERPVESGVSPGFTELDEVQDLELRKRTWRDVIAAARAAGDPGMMELLEAGVRPSDLDHAFKIICVNDDVEFPPGEGQCPDATAAWKAIEKFWKELQKHLPSTIDPETTCKIQKAALQFRGQLRVSRGRLDRPSTIASLLGTWDCESKITLYQWSPDKTEQKRLKALINSLHADFRAATVAPYLSQWRQYVYRLSVTLLTRARDNAAAERRRLNSLNYGDLLNLAARVLRENPQVRRALQQKYRFLFVDEFQDTDPVQAEIVFLLAADEPVVGRASIRPGISPADPVVGRSFRAGVSAADADWRKIPLRPGALFVVGDPKQSIYRFRRADIEIYNAVRERFSEPATGRVLPLTMNFRSVPELCGWANEVFETRFPKEATAHSPRFAPLDPKDAPKDDPDSKTKAPNGGVFTLTHACDHKEVIGEDAEKIARYIRGEVDAGRRKYSDFLILTRRKKARLAPYADALEALNVPIEVSGAGAFGDSAEVKALTILLRSLSDPQDALALVAVLRGPLFGVSDQELFAFKQEGGWFSVFFDPSVVGRPSIRVADSRVIDALSSLRQYYRWTRILPAGAALDRILESTGYLALAATTPGGVEAGDLLHAIDRVRQVVEEGGSLADAADALEADAEASNEVESLPLEPGRTDVVRLMNLHKAKGLEADVVFLADPCGGFPPRVDVHIERTGEQAQGWFQVVQKKEGSFGKKLLGEHADWAAHQATELPYRLAEEDRLLYVAATRAREVLVVSRWTGQKGTPAWGVLNSFLAKAPELQIPTLAPARSPKVLDCSTGAQASAAAAMASSHDRVRRPSWSIASVTSEARHIATMARAAEPTGADDVTKVVVPDTESHRADAGMAWGTLIHGLLEHAMRHKDASREDLRRLAMWLTVEELQLRAVVEDAIDTVQRVARAEFWAEATAGEHTVEAPFVFAPTPGSLSSGVIDLLFRSDRWHVVDYKTDIGLTSGSAGAYAQQLKSYEDAMKSIGIDDVESTLQNVRAGDQ